tara:strand:+ start:1323 stop:1466 length:144 start_codon:yes stop_codon:yes gene_type:complete
MKSIFGLDGLLSGFFPHEMNPKNKNIEINMTLFDNNKKCLILINIAL